MCVIHPLACVPVSPSSTTKETTYTAAAAVLVPAEGAHRPTNMPHPTLHEVLVLAGMIAIALATFAQGFTTVPAAPAPPMIQRQRYPRHEGRLAPCGVGSPLVFSTSSFLPAVTRGVSGGSGLPTTATSMSCMLGVGELNEVYW